MSKSKCNDDALPCNSNNAPRKPGGRTIGRWRVQAREELPNGTDEQIAALMTRYAVEEGFFAYECSVATVARWREYDARKPARPAWSFLR